MKSISTFVTQQQLLRLVVESALLTMMLTSTTAYLALTIISVIDLYFFGCNDFVRWCGMVDEGDEVTEAVELKNSRWFER
ncbi:hypothetical protein TSUD_349420 [Trifolium subterraneum]|uniref:Uncharacterized protein n=1 Tax=Trifolium subterraneum TaxID=3900 RepID=A0A2Z6P4F7_TRISU|nr:hypothetical protein TSUD_349420 [Trifolium subterraneum]